MRVSNISRAIFLATGFLGMVFAVIFFFISINQPSLGVELKLQNGSWVVSAVDATGLAQRDGIEVGSTVISINGQPVTSIPSNIDIISTRGIRDLEVVGSQGIEKAISVVGNSNTSGQLAETLSYFVIGFAFWVIGAYVFIKKPAINAAVVMYMAGSAILLGLTSVSAQERGVFAALELEFFCLLMIGALFSHLFLIFPKNKIGFNWLKYLIYLPSIVAFILFVSLNPDDAETILWFRMTLLPILVLGIGVGLISLVHSSIKADYVRIKQQARIVLTGALVGGLPFLILSALPFMVWQELLVPPQYSIMALVALPMSIAYTLIRHQLFDIDLVIRRSIIYGLLSVVLAVAFLGIIWSIFNALSGIMNTPAIAIILLVLAILALVSFDPARNKVQSVLDRRYYKDRYDYKQIVSTLSSNLNRLRETDEIAHFVTASTARVLSLSGSCLLLYDDKGNLEVKYSVGEFEAEQKTSTFTAIASALDEEGLFPNQAPPDTGASFLIRLFSGNKQVGFLCLGNKLSREGYTVDDLSFLFTFSGHAATAIESARLSAEAQVQRVEIEVAYEQLQASTDELLRSKQDLEEAYLAMTKTLVLSVESRDRYTRGHSERVGRISQGVASIMGLSREETQKLELAARLHDIGKIGVADNVLLKPGPLTPSERAEVELHSTKGVEILRFLDFLYDILPLIESHHERYDGKGYPKGMKGKDIPLGGRILAVADCYDAMVTDRPHRSALPHEEALQNLRDGAGTQWDPEVVEAFMYFSSEEQ